VPYPCVFIPSLCCTDFNIVQLLPTSAIDIQDNPNPVHVGHYGRPTVTSWVGVSILDNEVRIFHRAAIHDLRILLTDAGLSCWYFAKGTAEAEAALCFDTLLQLVGEEAQFLNPPRPDGVDDEDKWNGFDTNRRCKPTTSGACDNAIKKDGNEAVGTAQFSSASANGSDEGLFYGDPIDDEEFSGEAFDRHADEVMAVFTTHCFTL
jgi:hypothetical protein